jgi:2',3'-cyclic-nucleotide 2'-phosphodiesterase (5'-nucleotidase family)
MTDRGPVLRIVQINDVYSLEHLPRLATLVRHHATHDPADAQLVVLAGDFLAPSMLSSLDGGEGMVDCLNALGVTHVTFGNHEDDVSARDLRARVAQLHACWLATNVHGFEPPLPESDVVEVCRPGGRRVRVGLVGVVMEDPAVYRAPPFGGAQLEPANAAVLRVAATLVRERGCACVVPLTHQPIDLDRELARQAAGAALAVIVGGHEHVPFLETIAGTHVVKAGTDASKAAILDLVWDPEAPAEGTVDRPRVTVRLEDTADYAEDPDLRRRVDGHMAKVHALEGATLMTLPAGETISSVGGRARPTAVATLLCTLLRDALGAEACLFNAGGIRASRDYVGHFTYGDLKAEVPFDNEIVVVRMPGRVVREAVTASRAMAPAESGAFLHVDDRVVVEEPGNRVVAMAGAPLEDGRLYAVAIVRNLLDGMDHIEPLVRFAHEHPDLVPPVGSGREVKIVLVDAFARALWRTLGGFDAVDANHDGRVTQNEIADAVARLTHRERSEIGAALVLNALDVKHQGSITRDELGPGDEADD